MTRLICALAFAVFASVFTLPVSTSLAQQGTSCNIKGNISASGEKIYHVPGQRYYERTKVETHKGERWFCSEREARAAGWRKSKV